MVFNKSSQLCQTGYQKKDMRSRRGGMLILVVIILAVGIILITSALMITVAARNHYYQASEEDQTGLTALSVAQTIGQAVENADIKDDELIALADNKAVLNVTAASDYSSSATAVSGTSLAPGLANTANSNTTVTFGYYPSESDPQYISARVETILDTGVQSGTKDVVTLLLSEKDRTLTTDAFANQVTLGSDATDNAFLMFGMGYDNWESTDTLLVFHGDNVIYQSGSDNAHNANRGLWSDVVVTGTFCLGAGGNIGGTNSNAIEFEANFILMGDDACIDATASKDGIFKSNVLAFGSEALQRSVFVDSTGADAMLKNGADIKVSGSVYLSNRTILDSSGSGQRSRMDLQATNTGYIADDSSTIVTNFTPSNSNQYYKASDTSLITLNTVNVAKTTNPLITSMQALADTYTTPEKMAYINHTVMTTADALTAKLAEYTDSADVRSELGTAKRLDTELTTGTNTDLSGEAYYIDTNTIYKTLGATGNAWSTSTSRTSISFDLSGNDITLYIVGSNTFTIGSGALIFKNGGAYVGRIVLLDGADIYINVNKYFQSNAGTPKSLETGIIGTGCPYAVWSDWPMTVYGYKPYVYIIGMYNNTVTGCNRSVLEAYVGLYGEAGNLELDYYCYFFGRVESAYVHSRESANGIDFPYCPGPNDLVNHMHEAIRSSYQISGYVTAASEDAA